MDSLIHCKGICHKLSVKQIGKCSEKSLEKGLNLMIPVLRVQE